MKRESILSIQVLRALAAWLVVFHHFGKETTSNFGSFFSQHGNFGVDIFFVISGFIISYVTFLKDTGPKEFLVNRLFRIVPAYWFATITFIIVKELMPQGFDYTDWNIKTLIASLLFIPVQNPAGLGPFPVLIPGWTLNVEIFFYILLTTCFAFGKRYRFIVCSLALLVIPIFYDRESFYGSVLGTRKLYEFVFGIIICHVYMNISKFREFFPRLGVIMHDNQTLIGSCMMTPILCFLYLDRDGMRLLAAGLLVSSGLFLENSLFNVKSRFINYLARLGEISYSTYLFHYFVIGAIVQYIGIPQNGLEEFFEWIVMVSFVVLMSLLGYKFVEMNVQINRLKYFFIKNMSR